MLKNITIGQYIPGQSVIHRLDPRGKILLTIAYIVFVFSVKGFVGYALVIGFILGVTALSRISFRYMARSLKSLVFIILMTAVLNLFFTRQGKVILPLGFLSVTDEGLTTALYFAFRIVFLVLGTSLLTLTTSPIALTDGLERLLSPLRIVRFPAHELAMMMTIALRFIPTLLEETDKIMKAQSSRGADFESGNLFQRSKAMVPLLVPLFISAFRRAGELAMAMEARCYRGGEGRTRLRTLHYTSLDAYAALLVAVMGFFVFLERAWVI
ncbi:MAG TPA: energy-coupling factor transporter transmembrane protein EcfT [Clostridia bacterium]|nr:energy-coupling factor transporter transmembrane protein EcfT [Clostridia bacterium]